MVWAFFGAVAVGLIAVFAALVSGRWGYDPMSEPVHTAPDPGLTAPASLPDLPLATPLAAQVADVRFDTGLRGYRMDQVDEVLATLTDRLAAVEEELALLRAAGMVSPRSEHPSPFER